MRTQYGSPLSMDKQLYWLLEQEVLFIASHLCPLHNLLRRYNYVLRLLVDREVGSGRILLLKYCERQTDIIPLSVNLDELHSYLHRCRAYDFLLKVSRIPCNNKQDDN